MGLVVALATASLALDSGAAQAAADTTRAATAPEAASDASFGMAGSDRPLSAADALADLTGRAPGGGGKPKQPVDPIPAPPAQVEWSSEEVPSSSAEPVLAEGGTLPTDMPEVAAEASSVAAASGEVAVIDAEGKPAAAPIDVGGSPVAVSLVAGEDTKVAAAESPQVALSVLDSAAAEQVGFDRVAFMVDVAGLDAGARADGVDDAEATALEKAVNVDVAVDYSEFADEFGADWAGRLQLVRFEPCALAPEEGSECPGPSVVEGFTNDLAGQKITATLPLDALVGAEAGLSATSASSGTTSGFALLAGASSSTGDYTTTSLNPQGSWAVGAQSGDFSWSYPISAPAPAAGAAPGVSVGYSSAAIDGLTSDQNTQGGVLGPGWSLSEGFIERSYKPCGADGGLGADNCWVTDNATFSFAGMNDKLVRTGSEYSGIAGWDASVFQLESHTGWIVKRLSQFVSSRGGFGVDDNGEYWVAISPDGTKYYFGYGKESGDGSPGTALGSVQTVPVVGNHDGEPCHEQSYNWCHQAYRWSLDRIEDSNGRVTTFHYTQEQNYYGIRATPGWSEPYVSAAVLVRIEYGQLPSSAATADRFSHAISFTYHYRCNNPESDGICRTAPTAATAANFPDIPTDLFCPDSYCTNYSPSFFTRHQLKFISTQVRNTSGALVKVGVDAFATEWVDADGSGSDPARLWLRFIQHNGQQGGAPVYLPAIRFDGAAFANRVDYNNPAGVTQMRYFRVNSIVDEYGSQIRVTYTQPKPCPSPWPATPPSGWQGFQENSWSCYARWWTPPSGPSGFSVWHKYVVDRVVQIDQSAPASQRSPWRWWEYDYPDVSGNEGGMAWHSDRNPLVGVGQRSWGEYRGFERVRVIRGNTAETNRASTETTYFRGMWNDINSHSNPDGFPRDQAMTPGGYFEAFDEEQLAGLYRETRVTNYDNASSTPGWELYSSSLTNYNSYFTSGFDGTSWQVEPVAVYTISNYGGAVRRGKIDYTYDSHPWMRRLIQTVDWGRVGAAPQRECLRERVSALLDSAPLGQPPTAGDKQLEDRAVEGVGGCRSNHVGVRLMNDRLVAEQAPEPRDVRLQRPDPLRPGGAVPDGVDQAVLGDEAIGGGEQHREHGASLPRPDHNLLIPSPDLKRTEDSVEHAGTVSVAARRPQ